MEAWQAEAELKTYGGAVADAMQARIDDGERFDMSSRRVAGLRQTCFFL